MRVMKVKVRSLAGFRHILGGDREVDLAEGARIEDLLQDLCAAEGGQGLRPLLFDAGGLKGDVNILVNGRNVESLQGLQTELAEGDDVALFPAAIGG